MESDSKVPTAEMAEAKKANAPPEMITVDTGASSPSGAGAGAPKEEADGGTACSEATPSKSDTASQARTPKHANKAKEGEEVAANAGVAGVKQEQQSDAIQQSSEHQRNPSGQHQHPSSGWNNGPPPPGYQSAGGSSSNYPPPPHYDQRGAGVSTSGGAFQPRERTSFPPPMQVSPGGGRYYYASGQSRSFGGYERYPSQQQGADFSMAPGYPQQQRGGGGGGGGYPPMYPQQYSGSFDGPPQQQRAPQPSWGPPPFHGRPPHHMSNQPPPQHQQQHPDYNRGAASAQAHQHQHPNNNGNFSRAVSSSFDRSIKSGQEMKASNSPKQLAVGVPLAAQGDSGSVSEDASWGALKQVHSVDEEEMRKRLSKRKNTGSSESKDVIVNEPTSNSSSLTNSPTGEQDAVKKAASKQPSSLDSLSSVASAQEPLDTSKVSKVPSPDGSGPSLELMKCPSGTSALLLPSHARSLSHFSLSGIESKGTVKRDSDDEERDPMDEKETDAGPAAKKARTEGDKKSPLSITCSPPTSPGGTKKKTNDARMHQPQAMYPHTKGSPAFFDKPPTYSYSMESAPHMPPRPESYPNIPGGGAQRPGSSASSTITPMNVDGAEMRQPPAVAQMPSWEIHGQDSFGGASAGGVGGPLMGSFSFQQDYQMLGPTGSVDHGHPMQQQGPPHPPPPMQQPHHGGNPNQTLESRNQSFEGGHYHGNFGRNDSMMSYEGRQMSFDNHGRYQGPFPPQAPSWGSAGSYPPGYGGPAMHQRMGYPPMMRNYSEDSGTRTSPPPGSGSMRMMPPNFPPPPEFRAPPSMVNNKGGPQNTIMTSPYQPSPKVGPFGWSKEEDGRLTEIMKKYKNPRDWDPIAKEHNRGRTYVCVDE